MNNKLLPLLFFILVSACAPSRNLVYLSNLNAAGEATETIKNRVDPKIQPDDLLSITVSSLNSEANMLFNSGVMQSAGVSGGGSAAPTVGKANEGYLVDKNGAINFPVLGNVTLAGLTKEQATDKMTSEIKRHIKDPIVNVKFLNFRITVIGEVARPSTFTLPTERVNIIEALALAGDLTAYGKRENILIIHEDEGIRKTVRVDLNDKSLLNSRYYYLQQNDIVYVEPAKLKKLQTGSSSFYLGLISASVSVISIIVFLTR
ncbi:MAG: sugar transporter [Sphingobacteriaceae bacterium]|nr:MAG: sugar transporter [Sphingobacteriaceae bacterium]